MPLPRIPLPRPTTILVTAATLLTIRNHIITIDTVRGSSMSPALSPQAHTTGTQDLVLINRWSPTKNLARGDVITFWKPHRPNEISIKRVVALPGDVVWPRDRESGTRDGYGGHGERGNFVTKEGRVKVPRGHVWVEGDNWRGSLDSNDFGPVSLGLVDGRAVGVLEGGWVRGIQGVDKREKGRTRVAVEEGDALRFVD